MLCARVSISISARAAVIVAIAEFEEARLESEEACIGPRRTITW
jgi:hypothetical protein